MGKSISLTMVAVCASFIFFMCLASAVTGGAAPAVAGSASAGADSSAADFTSAGSVSASPTSTSPRSSFAGSVAVSAASTSSGSTSANAGIDFANEAETYLEYIGTNLKNRSCTEQGASVASDNRNEATRTWIIAELTKAGYDASQITQQDFSGEGDDDKTYDGTNIVLTIPGKSSAHQVIVGAHFDGDGCGDNGSGVALLLAEAVGLHDMTPAFDVKIVFFDGEEVGSLGAYAFAGAMSKKEVAKTVYMVNIDSIAFGDYCNLYGGDQDDDAKTVTNTGAYEYAMKIAASLGIKTYTTDDLDGYFAKHGCGPAIEDDAVYTNPWTYKNPAPLNADCFSPATGDWSDHAPFDELGIPYIYLEATDWYAEGDGGEDAYTGYFETADASLGDHGMFMNTDKDTLEMLQSLFPGRALQHLHVFSPILSSLILDAQVV